MKVIKPIVWGLAVALYLRFGLEPTGWLFYELSHLLGIDWLYWGYSIFRVAGHFFGYWPLQNLACILAGLLIAALVLWRQFSRHRTAETA